MTRPFGVDTYQPPRAVKTCPHAGNCWPAVECAKCWASMNFIAKAWRALVYWIVYGEPAR